MSIFGFLRDANDHLVHLPVMEIVEAADCLNAVCSQINRLMESQFPELFAGGQETGRIQE